MALTTLLCPMKLNGSTFGKCERGSCSWWNDNLGECSVKSLSAVAFILGKLNETIKNKEMV